MARTSSKSTGLMFLTRQQVAQVLKVPHRLVDHWIATGQLRPFRLSAGVGRGGQRVYYSTTDARRLKRVTRTRRRR